MYNLKIAIRNISRSGIHAVINIAGLAVGLAAVIIIALWVDNELNFNRWYPNFDKLYLTGYSYSNRSTLLRGSEPLFKSLQAEFPEVKNVSHFLNDENVTLYAVEEENVNGFKETGAYVDSEILEMLDVKFLRGAAQSAFQAPYPIVLSEGLAKKLFGREDPINKILRVNNYAESYQVTGVFREQPQNSSFQFQWLMPFTVLAKRYADGGWNPENDWNTTWFECLVELQPKVDSEAFNEKLKDIAKERNNGSNSEIFLYPISQLHLYGEFVDSKPVAGKRVRDIRELSMIAVIILLIACINFVNLSTARSGKRILEMGVRKTFGAKRVHLVWQLMRESAILTASALLLALMLIWIALPVINRLWNIDLSVHLWNIRHLGGILLVGIICTVLSGVYPAFFISAFNPNDMLKKLKNRSSNNAVWVRKGLVIFQFAASYILICMTIAVVLQIRHGQNRSLGFDKENLLQIFNVSQIPSQSVIRNEFGKNVFVEATAFSNGPLILSGNSGTGYQWQGKPPEMNPKIYRSYVSSGYIETVGIKLPEGRDFYEGVDTDTRSVIINQTLANLMGDEGRINGELSLGDIRYTVVGIMEDYICNDVYRASSDPFLFYKNMEGSPLPCLYVRFNSKVTAGEALKITQNTLSQFPVETPLEYAFVDNLVNRMFDGQKQQGVLAALFSILSILISCLGLFGLVTYIAESKIKEIGIRKVFGASIGDLVMMLAKEFLLLVTISIVIAFPFAYFWIDQMLQDYGYRIAMGWELFAMTILITMALTIFTVGWKARKAAKADIVKSLKVE